MNMLAAEHIRSVVLAHQLASRRTVVEREDLIGSAVLVPVVYEHAEPDLLLTQRTDRVETHKGQIAFPGGMVDPGDCDRTHTALREAKEEIGLLPSAVELCGLLDDLATPTGFVITPVVGLLRERPRLQLNAHEVAEAFYVPLRFFCEPANAEREFRIAGGVPREIWVYRYNGRVIWGATAAVIRHLVDLIMKPGPDLPEQNARLPHTPSDGRTP